MAAVLLFRVTNMVSVTSSENPLLLEISSKCLHCVLDIKIGPACVELLALVEIRDRIRLSHLLTSGAKPKLFKAG